MKKLTLALPTLNGLTLILSSQLTRYSFLISVICFFVSLLILGFNYSNLPPQIPLFYSRSWGDGRLATTPFILILPGTVFILMFFNALIISYLGVRFATKILSLSMVITSFLLSWTLIKIIFTIS